MKVRRLKPYSTKRIVLISEEEPIFYNGLEISEIDYTETTAWCNFADVVFKNGEKATINLNKL